MPDPDAGAGMVRHEQASECHARERTGAYFSA